MGGSKEPGWLGLMTGYVRDVDMARARSRAYLVAVLLRWFRPLTLYPPRAK